MQKLEAVIGLCILMDFKIQTKLYVIGSIILKHISKSSVIGSIILKLIFKSVVIGSMILELILKSSVIQYHRFI